MVENVELQSRTNKETKEEPPDKSNVLPRVFVLIVESKLLQLDTRLVNLAEKKVQRRAKNVEKPTRHRAFATCVISDRHKRDVFFVVFALDVR
jgi:hypothetical protein